MRVLCVWSSCSFLLPHSVFCWRGPLAPPVSRQRHARHSERSRPTFSSRFAPAKVSACAERNLSSALVFVAARLPRHSWLCGSCGFVSAFGLCTGGAELVLSCDERNPCSYGLPCRRGGMAGGRVAAR